jgi:hypothetical protein
MLYGVIFTGLVVGVVGRAMYEVSGPAEYFCGFT